MGSGADRDGSDDATGQAAKAAALIAGLSALLALKMYGTSAACSVLVGAVVGIANLLTMQALIRRLVRASVESDSGAGAIVWSVLAGCKILILLGVLGLLLTRRLVDPMPLLVGYMAMPFGIAASAVWSSFRSRY